MRHAKVICREVFSDNIICNSALLTVVDWGSGGSRECNGSREGNENTNKGNGNTPTQRTASKKQACDSRDDTDEFAPWKNGENRDCQGQSRIVQIQWPQKKASLKSSSMPVNGTNEGIGMKVKVSSATRKRTGSSRSFMGFRK